MSAFTEGYAAGLWNRPSDEGLQETPRDREKYADGYGLGVQDRLDGALEPVEATS